MSSRDVAMVTRQSVARQGSSPQNCQAGHMRPLSHSHTPSVTWLSSSPIVVSIHRHRHTARRPHPGPGPGLLTPSHCNVSAAQTNTMKVVPLSRAEHCEHDRVLRLWTSDLCGGGGRVQLVVVAGRALNNQVSCCAWHRCIQPSLLVTVSTSGH